MKKPVHPATEDNYMTCYRIRFVWFKKFRKIKIIKIIIMVIIIIIVLLNRLCCAFNSKID